MKRLILLLLVVLATAVIAGGSETALADGKDKGKGPKTKPDVVEKVVGRDPVYDDQGRLIGHITTVVGSATVEDASDNGGTLTQAQAAATAAYATRTKTCYTKRWMTNVWGWKLWQLKLKQTWGYNGSKIVWHARPNVSAWSRAGWSHTSPRKGIYWTRWPRYMRTWASSTFTFKIGWYTVQSRTVGLYFNINHNGQCFY